MVLNLNSSVGQAMDFGSLSSATQLARYIRFGPFDIDQQRQQVFRDATRLRLQGKVFQVLILLIQKQGEVVSREELRQALWPTDTHVNYDANVNTTVNKLRQALGESTEKPLYIETIPRKGYSFISTADFSDAPFPAMSRSSNDVGEMEARAGLAGSDAARPAKRWVTVLIVALILTGMLIGASAATKSASSGDVSGSLSRAMLT